MAAWGSLALFLLMWRLTGLDDATPGVASWLPLTDGRMLAAAIALAAGGYGFAAIARESARGVAFLRNRLWQWLGDISYSFYMLHPIVMAGIKRPVLSASAGRLSEAAQLLAFTLAALAVSLAVSHLSRKYVEGHFAALLRAAAHARLTRTA